MLVLFTFSSVAYARGSRGPTTFNFPPRRHRAPGLVRKISTPFFDSSHPTPPPPRPINSRQLLDSARKDDRTRDRRESTLGKYGEGMWNERNRSHPAATSSTMGLNSVLPLPLDRPPAGRCFTSRTMGHDLGVARSYPISVGRSMPHRPPAKIFLLFAGKTHRMWMCVHVRRCV